MPRMLATGNMTMSECSIDSWPQGYKASVVLRADARARIGACLRNSNKDIALLPGTSEGASFGRGGGEFRSWNWEGT